MPKEPKTHPFVIHLSTREARAKKAVVRELKAKLAILENSEQYSSDDYFDVIRSLATGVDKLLGLVGPRIRILEE